MLETRFVAKPFTGQNASESDPPSHFFPLCGVFDISIHLLVRLLFLFPNWVNPLLRFLRYSYPRFRSDATGLFVSPLRPTGTPASTRGQDASPLLADGAAFGVAEADFKLVGMSDLSYMKPEDWWG